jgi:hypothetical protein
VHLQIASQPPFPGWIRFENYPCVGAREKIAANRRGPQNFAGWLFDPPIDLLRDERPYPVKFGQRAAGGMEITGRFGPEKSAARRAAKGANQNARTRLGFSRQ